MKIECYDLKYTSKQYEVVVKLEDGREMIMDVNLGDDQYEDCIESYKTEIWNSLELEEKFAVEDLLRNKIYY